MKHHRDIFLTKRYGRAFVMVLIAMCGIALILLFLRAHEAAREELTPYASVEIR